MAQVGITLSQEQIDKLYSQVQEIIKKIQTDDKITLDLDNVNKQIEEIKNQLNGVSNDLKPIDFQVNTDTVKKKLKDVKGKFEDVIKGLSDSGKILDLTPQFNKNNKEIESFTVKLQEAEGLIEKISIKSRTKGNGYEEIPTGNFEIQKITEYDNRVNLLNKDLQELNRLKEQINNISSQKENESLQESLNLLKQDYDLERQINEAKQKGYDNLVKELEVQKEVNNTKFGQSASSLSSESTEKLIQQAIVYQNKLNVLTAQQSDKQAQVNEKLTQEVEKFKELSDIKLQNLETQLKSIDKFGTNTSGIKEEVAQLKELQSTINAENFSIKQQEFNTQLKQTQADLREVNTQVRDSKGIFDDLLHNTGEMLKWGISGTFLFGGLNQIKEGISYINDLNKAETNIQMITGMTKTQVDNVTQSYSNLAGQLHETTSSIMTASEEFLRAGNSAKDTSELLKSSTVMSKLAGESQQDSSEQLISIMNAYHLKATDMMGVVDKLVAVDNNAATSTAELATAMQKVSSSAQNAGVPMQTLVSWIGTISSTTRESATTIGTAINSIISRYESIKEGKSFDPDNNVLNNVEKSLNRYGIAVRKDKDTFKDFSTVIDEISKKWSSYNDVQKNDIATQLAGKICAPLYGDI